MDEGGGMSWLARLKNTENNPEDALQNLQKPDFVGFVGTQCGPFQNSKGNSASLLASFPHPVNNAAAPDPVTSPSSYGTAMTEQELDVLVERMALFIDRDLSMDDAEVTAVRLTYRDREMDDRRLCLECQHLFGGADSRRCSQWQKVGQINGPAIPGELVTLLQRCAGFINRLEVMK
jgi:hypothetical protein